MGETVLAVGAHIGDMDLAAGPYLAQNVLDGGTSVLLALTPGERGHPTMPIADYRSQKIAEGRQFADAIGAQFVVFDDLSDGLLPATEDIAARVAGLIRRLRPGTLVSHWTRSIHSDHENAAWIAQRARFLAGLPGWQPADSTEPTEPTDFAEPTDSAAPADRHGVARFLFAENWEDAAGFAYNQVASIGARAHDRWRSAIAGQAFARGETYGFRYIDYYDAQLTMRGCLHRTRWAVGFRGESDPVGRVGPTVPAD